MNQGRVLLGGLTAAMLLISGGITLNNGNRLLGGALLGFGVLRSALVALEFYRGRSRDL
jgi:hypothetical protein